MSVKRREMITTLAAMAALPVKGDTVPNHNSYLELKLWKMHNSAEEQETRVADFLDAGLAPAVAKGEGKLIGAFANVFGNDGPFYVTLTRWPSLAAFESWVASSSKDSTYNAAVDKLSAGTGLPFVRVESSLLRSMDVMPEPVVERAENPRMFELRTYESQSFASLRRKVGMFNYGEAKIFERLKFRPVFFGETIVGPRQPNLMYMVSYENLAVHDKLWGAFGQDPEWKKLSAQPGLSDAEIVANISNVVLRPLISSAIR